MTTDLCYAWHLRLGPREPVLCIHYSDIQPTIGAIVGIQNPSREHPSSDLEQFYVICEIPARGIDDGRTHSLCTLAPKKLPTQEQHVQV
jgi:hypothetical protein